MLQQAIDRLYTAFANVPKPRRIEGCPHCVDDKEIKTLLKKPLRQLSSEDLTAYASSALLTVGDVADYLYFLPRILEISAADESWWPDPEITARAIRATDLATWPSHRVDALVSFNAAVIQSAIDSETYDQIDSWICAIARMGLDIQPCLQMISNSPAAILAYFDDNARCLPKHRLCNAFWELPSAEHDAIVNWFSSDEIRRIPFEAYGDQWETGRE